MKIKERHPWAFLDDWRGKEFNGEWPTLQEMFTINTKRFGDRPCFVDFVPEKVTQTYNEVYSNITNLADWLYEQGIRKGDRVAVSGKNSGEWATVYLAAGFAGAIIVPIDYGLRNDETENLLKASGAKILFIDEEKHQYFTELKTDVQIYSLSPKHSETYVYNLKAKEQHQKEQPQENDVAAILFTSGTTGIPKGVMLTHKNLVSDCYIAQLHIDIYPTDVFYAILPIHHAYTMLAVFIETISTGASVVFGKSMAVSRLMKELHEGQITMLLGVPLLFNKILSGILKGIKDKGPLVSGILHGMLGISYFINKVFHVNPGKKMFGAVLKKANLDHLRIAISGGGPLAASVFKTYQQLGIDFIQGYGLTETSPIIALNPAEHFKIESVGAYFYPMMEMRIADQDENGVGEVQVKGPMVMKGYYEMPEETAKVFTEDGWLKTGDLGKLDNERYLILCGRAKNLIVTEGGKNVFPEEIENEFQLVSDIEQITIVGYIMNEETKSEGIEALVYPSEDCYKRLGGTRGNSEDDEKVRKVCQEAIDKVNKTAHPYAKITRLTILEEPLEMTTTKKVKRIYK